MQAFLIKLITAIIFPLIDKLWDVVNAYLEKQAQKKKDDKAADDAKSKMDKAKTAKEIDEASDDTLSGI
jgi:hypothetical protein